MGTYHQYRETTESVSQSRKHPASHEELLLPLLQLHTTEHKARLRLRLLVPDADPCTSSPAAGWGGLRACKTGGSSSMSSSWAFVPES